MYAGGKRKFLIDRSYRLSLLTLNGNQIKTIGSRAFEPIHQIKILSLSNNDISSIVDYRGIVFI